MVWGALHMKGKFAIKCKRGREGLVCLMVWGVLHMKGSLVAETEEFGSIALAIRQLRYGWLCPLNPLLHFIPSGVPALGMPLHTCRVTL